MGQIQFTVTTDSGSVVFEYNTADTAESNNTASLAIDSSLAAYPDLQVTNLSIAPTIGLESGSLITIIWSDANTGNQSTAAGSWSDSIVIRNLDTGVTLSTTTLPYDSSAVGNGAIDPGQFHTRQFTYTLPDGINGVGTIEATIKVDSGNTMFESNAAGNAESNNASSVTQTSTLRGIPISR